MLCNKVSFESSWIVLTMILRIILRKNAWILEHNIELQEILHRTMQGIVSIAITTSALNVTAKIPNNLHKEFVVEESRGISIDSCVYAWR